VTNDTAPPYTYELASTGCPSCGRGESWRITGPTPIDTHFMTEDDVKVAVDGANRLYAQIQESVLNGQ